MPIKKFNVLGLDPTANVRVILNTDLANITLGNTYVSNLFFANGMPFVSGGGGTTVTVSNTVPVTSASGSLWLNSETGELYAYTANVWIQPVGGMGPAGVDGATGATGPAGINGATGATGATGFGATGATGPQGATGFTGNVGSTGATGPAGTNANVSVTSTAPVSPNLGTMWLNSETGDLYIYINGGWAVVSGEQGPIGPNGATGATGPSGSPGGATGATGLTGATGIQGIVGATGASGPVANQLLNTNSSVTFSNLTVSSLISLTATSENVTSITGAVGTVSHNLGSSTIFFHTSLVGNFTANFVNVPTTNDRVISVVLILQQGATPFICNAVQIDGAAQTVYYINAAAPAGTANRRETQSFSLIRSANAWTVLGTLGSFG